MPIAGTYELSISGGPRSWLLDAYTADATRSVTYSLQLSEIGSDPVASARASEGEEVWSIAGLHVVVDGRALFRRPLDSRPFATAVKSGVLEGAIVGEGSDWESPRVAAPSGQLLDFVRNNPAVVGDEPLASFT